MRTLRQRVSSTGNPPKCLLKSEQTSVENKMYIGHVLVVCYLYKYRTLEIDVYLYTHSYTPVTLMKTSPVCSRPFWLQRPTIIYPPMPASVPPADLWKCDNIYLVPFEIPLKPKPKKRHQQKDNRMICSSLTSHHLAAPEF